MVNPHAGLHAGKDRRERRARIALESGGSQYCAVVTQSHREPRGRRTESCFRYLHKVTNFVSKIIFWVKSKITILSWKNILDPNFLSQIVADVETRRSSPYLSSGDNFGKSYEENQVTENSHTIYNTIYLQFCDLRYAIFYQELRFCSRKQYITFYSHGLPLANLQIG
jgi:hypothetical protein